MRKTFKHIDTPEEVAEQRRVEEDRRKGYRFVDKRRIKRITLPVQHGELTKPDES